MNRKIEDNFLTLFLLSLIPTIGACILIFSDISQASFFVVRLCYGLLFFLAIIIITFQFLSFNIDGYFSPLSLCMFGFLYFLIITPTFFPKYFEVYKYPNEFIPLVIVILLGMLSYCLGFRLSPDVHWFWLDRWMNNKISKRRLSNIVLCFIFLYILIIFYISQKADMPLKSFIFQNYYFLGNKEMLMIKFQGGAYYVLYIFRLLPTVFILPAIACFDDPHLPLLKRILIIFGIILMGVIIFYSGARMPLAIYCGSIGVYLILKDRNKKTKKVKNFCKTVTFIVVILLFLSSSQIITRGQHYLFNSLDTGFKLMPAIAYNLASETTDQNYTLYRAIKANKEGRLQHLYGESFFLVFVAFVPRALWATKPGGDDMYRKLIAIDPWMSNYNISHSILGELIYNFGWIGIIVGMIFFGTCSGIWWHLFIKYRDKKQMLILYSMSIIQIAFIVRGTFNATFGALMYPMLMVIILLSLSYIRKV
jgi:oligosaccharide repeat unit polymerase